MSTFLARAKALLAEIFPEMDWRELQVNEYNDVFRILSGIAQLDTEVVRYIKEKRRRIGFFKQPKSGGGWTVRNNITLQWGAKLLEPYALSLIIHESLHLKQSIWMRLSMQGELYAWQYQKKTYPEIANVKGNPIGSKNEAYAGTQIHWDELAKLSPTSRDDLKTAQDVMIKISPNYRSKCLPLYPLPKEVWYHLTRGDLKNAFGAVKTLVMCK